MAVDGRWTVWRECLKEIGDVVMRIHVNAGHIDNAERVRYLEQAG